MRLVVLLLIAGCGRIGFGDQPRGDGGTRDGGGVDAPDGPPPPFDVISPDATLPAGLVVWFPMDESAPAFAADVVSGFGGTCGMGSCPQSGTGHHGGAFLFDGINDCIEVANMGQFGQAEITIAIWIEPYVSSAGSAVAKPVDLSTTSDTWQLETSASDEVSFTSSHGTTTNTRITSPAGTLTVMQWHHVAATFDGTTRRLYVDGVEVDSAAAPGPLAYDSNSVWLGCDDNGGTPALRFNGALDDFQIYNRALSLAEIQMLVAM